MRAIGIIALLASSLVLGGCGGGETQPKGGTSTTGTPGDTANALTIHTGELEVPALHARARRQGGAALHPGR